MNYPIVYNLTIKLSKEFSSELIDLLSQSILPFCTDGQSITSSQINRILVGDDEEDETIAVQFIYPNGKVFEEQRLRTMAKFLGMVDDEYRGKYVYFATHMELLHLQH